MSACAFNGNKGGGTAVVVDWLFAERTPRKELGSVLANPILGGGAKDPPGASTSTCSSAGRRASLRNRHSMSRARLTATIASKSCAKCCTTRLE